LSVAGGQAIEDADGLYVSMDEIQPILTEAARLLQAAVDRRPHPLTETQTRDALRWLVDHGV
jgi:hypothetical protein